MLIPGVVALACGAPYSIRSNELIAQIAAKNAKEMEAPIYTQLDVQFTYPQLKMSKGKIEVTYTKEKPGKPPPTLRIARGAVQWAKENGLTCLFFACAAPRKERCRRDLEFAVKEAGMAMRIYICAELLYKKDADWFCTDSTDPRTRNRKGFMRREWLLFALPMFLYKFIAS